MLVLVSLLFLWAGVVCFILVYLYRDEKRDYLQRSRTYRAQIVLDSLSPEGVRLTTVELTYPRFIHQEVLTHRSFARNAMSSRAVPTMTFWWEVLYNPAGPILYGRRTKSMSTKTELSGWRWWTVHRVWYWARLPVLACTFLLYKAGLHKQTANRLLEPWQWMTTVMTGNEVAFKHLFLLRCHPEAQPEFRRIASLLKLAYETSSPVEREDHIPFLNLLPTLPPGKIGQRAVSVALCAQTSYLNRGRDLNKLMDLHNRLLREEPQHVSPFEHVAIATGQEYRSGPFKGWRQYREQLDQCWSEFHR